MVRFFRSVPAICLLACPGLPALAQDWLETTIEISELTEAGDLDAAMALSTRLLDSAEQEFGPDSEQLAESHMIVAELQMADQDYLAAEDNMILAIQLYERVEGPLSTILVVPYSDLGDAYLASEEYALAMRAYEEARGISRRNFGLSTVTQVPLVYRMANANQELGDMEEAVELRVEAVQLIQRNYGVSSEQSFAAVYELAGWLSEHEYLMAAADQYRSASNLLRVGLEGDDLEVIHLLRLAADHYRRAARGFSNGSSGFGSQGGSRPPSELLTAQSIARNLGSEYLLLQAELWRDIGDWYVAFGDRFRIAEAYLRGIAMLDEIENGDEIYAQWFNETAQVYASSLRARELSDEEDALTGRVELQFEVSEWGTANNVKVISSDPDGLLEREARRHIDLSRFRPNIVDGQLVPAVRTYTLEYRYAPEFAED